MGLREQKKELTRRTIAEVAWRLFADEGFDKVTVTQVAREAQVAPATVFNYFPTKEDLFFGGLDSFGQQLVDAVRRRPAQASPLAAFGDFLRETGGFLESIESGEPQALAQARMVNRIVADSAALRAREEQAFSRHTAALADLLAGSATTPEQVFDADVAAHAMIGVHRSLIRYVRQRILNDDTRQLAQDVRRFTESALRLLETGLADYGTDPTPST